MRLPRSAAPAAATLALAALALAAPLAPRPVTAQAVPALTNEKYVLPNGLQVILHQDHSVP
ncbi:MAG TPA: hypothetical protein VFX39_05375, partial [Gemmatimonadaceae bacterium]|nr:hypothetical protein [Gemmatimonadaceae bacterium]